MTSIAFKKPPPWLIICAFAALVLPFALQILAAVCFATLVSRCVRPRRRRR